MGEVYRATDTKLGRDVAVKVLPAEMSHDSERLGRFRREAKALAQLDHPNIVTIYSVEESDGVHFLTMQLVDGQPLDRLIARGGLPFERIVEIGSALAEALAAAHEKGIVHRDLKPANVMVGNEGRITVLDFGLAKDVRGGNAGDATLTSASHTEAGMVMGTPAYMSPEQVSGRTLDHRTDIFSFGVLLHEIAAGQRPFEGGSTAELISSILRDTPPPVTDLRADLPADLARVIRRCLEKDPRHRVQTARDLGNEFRDMARAVTGSTLISTSAGRAHAAADSGAANADEGFWVAVLPFRCGGASADLTALAEALSEEVVTGLSRFSYLKVVARGSAARFAGQPVDVRDAGKELNARYVLEGTLRQAGSRLRLAVQLADVVSGAHLWAESYERAFSPDSVFELQDDLVPRIVSTVADMNGVLPRSMSEGLRSRSPEQLSPYEAVLRSFYYCTQGTAEELAAARSGLEMAIRRAPASSDAWAMLAFLCCQDYVHGFNLQADSLNAGVAAGRRAVETGPSNHLAHFSLAQALFMQKEYQAFRNAAERTVTLNPMDGNSMAFLGELLTYARDEIRGIELAQRAKQLNPNHPGWYWYADFYNAYRQGDYEGALEFALKVNMPSHYAMYLMVAATCGQLGEYDQAAKALRELLRMRPDIASILRSQAAKVWNPEYSDRFLEGLRKAGLEIPEDGAASSRELPASAAGTRAKRESGAARSTEGFWVAVLPFRHGGGDPNLAALADGLTDDIVTNMSKFSYLRVVARSSTAQYAQGTVDVRTAAKELGARYVVEGSIRQAGAKVRIAAQLVDAGNGASLWAETYDRTLAREAMLDLLDDVVSRIVATVGDTQGILAHSMTEALRNRDPESLTPHEALLRSFGFHQHVSEAEHLAGRTALERAVKQAPDHADCWAMLSWLFRAEYTYGYNPLPDPMGRSLAAARRAVDLAPSNQLAQAALASAFFFRRELPAFRSTAERALTLNHVVGYTTAFLGMHFAYSGDWERGCALAERSTQLNPHHPGWYWFPMVLDAYRRGDGKRAMEYVLRINMPGLWTAQVALAVVNSQLGQMEQARIALRDLLAIRPDFAAKAREELGIWWQPEMVEQMLGDLCKAGLGRPDAPVAPLPASGTAPVSQAIAKALRVRLSPQAVSQRYTPRLAAYEVYLKARHHEAQVTPESLDLARRCYEQACELDSAFGMARVGLGVYWLNVAYFGRRPARQCMAEAQTEVRRALQIDPSLPDAHALLGYLAAMDMDWATAGRHFDSPMARQASIGVIRSVYSGFLYLRGNAEEAIRLAQGAIEEDPLDVWAHMNLHAYLQAAGRDAEALEQLKRVLELDQNQVVAMVSMAMIYADRGHLAEALKIARRGYATGPWFPDTIGVLAALLRRNGNEEEAKSIANELGSGDAAGDARGHALFHLLSGELDEGAGWVEKAIEERDPSMMFYLRFVVCRGLRASHRWPAIAKLTNLPA